MNKIINRLILFGCLCSIKLGDALIDLSIVLKDIYDRRRNRDGLRGRK